MPRWRLKRLARLLASNLAKASGPAQGAALRLIVTMENKTRAFARGRRRRWVWAAVVALGHVGLFLLLSVLTPPPAPMTPTIVNVSLFPGEGPAGGGSADADPARTPAATPPASADPAPAAPEAAAPVEAASEPTPAEPQPPTPAPSEPVSDSLDVLATVQRLVGAQTASAPSQAAEGPPGDGGGSVCDAVAGGVLAAIQTDEKALGALSRLPTDALSVAGALQLWDGAAWAEETALGGKGVTLPIREAAVRALAGAPAECLDAPVIGPRFLIVEPDKRAVVLVLGSGVWRWRDLILQAGVQVDTPPPSPLLPQN